MNTVLIVDDSIVACSVIQHILTSQDYEVFVAHSGSDALLAVADRQPDLILLDIILYGESGYDICKQLKDNDETKEIPIIFITSSSDETSIVECFACGGVDYISKPFSTVELLARVEAHIKLKQMREMLLNTNNELASMNMRLAEMVTEKEMWGKTDQLTKLYNRHYITEMIPIWNQQLRGGRIFSMIMLDIDDFKQINDIYGHCTGDFLLQSVSNVIKYHCRDELIATRWGGEEFLVIAPDMDIDATIALAEALRQQIEQLSFEYDSNLVSCTATFGISQVEVGLGLEKNVARADAALYEGKRNGKNCIVTA